MAANSDLFDLIKSLSKSEKRYFRRTAALNERNGDAKYLALFDMIDARATDDAAGVREEFAAKYSARYFSETKYYLYHAILRALHAFGAEHAIDVRIGTLLHQASILFERRLFGQCEKLLARAAELAGEHERWHLAAEARRQEYRLLERSCASPEHVEQLLGDLFRCGDRWRSRFEYWAIYARMQARLRSAGMPRNREQLAAFTALLGEAGDPARHPPDVPADAIYHRLAIALTLEASGDARGALCAYEEVLSIVRRTPAWMASPDIAVIPILCNICLLAITAADTRRFFGYYPELLELLDSSPRSASFDVRLQALSLLPGLHLTMGVFRIALELAAPVLEALALAGSDVAVGRRSNVTILLLAIHFGLGDYDTCIDLVNALFALAAEGLPAHHLGVARIFQLMIHFERGDVELLEHLLRSAHRFFVANRAGYRAEEAIIAFLKRALRSRDRAALQQQFAWLLGEIAPLRDDPFEDVFLQWIGLDIWLESKLSGRPLDEHACEAYRARGEAGDGGMMG